MDGLLQDLRYALRVLAKAPAFTAITVLTMAIGTGANATVFSFISALLLRPAPGVTDPSSLIAIYTSDFSSGPYGDSSYPDYLALANGTSTFAAMAAEHDDATGVVRVGDVIERVRFSSVTGNYFGVLGLQAWAGRLIAPGDTAPDAAPVAVIAQSLWRRAFSADPTILGSTLTVNARTYTVIGITPERFQGVDLGRAVEIWIALPHALDTLQDRGSRRFSVLARLRPDSTLSQAQAQVSAIAARLADRYPETNRGILGAPNAPRPMLALEHTRLAPQFRGMVTTLGAILMTAVGLVLVIACANIASLLLSRTAARDREMAVRLALGAGRPRVIRQLLAESLLLGLGGGGLGLIFSLWTADLLPSFFPADQARMLDTTVDSTAILFIIALSVVSSMLFGLAPALHAARPGTGAALRSRASHVSDNPIRARMRRVLVAAQVALAVILLIGAALLTQSVVNGMAADPGFATRDALVASVELPDAEFTPEQGLLYYQAALERIGQLRGVQRASFVRTLPTTRLSRRGFELEGYQPQPGEDTELHVNTVSVGYFETLQIPLLAGRTFDNRDRADGVRVAIINELLAGRYFHGNAVGRRLTDSSGTVMKIIGVVRSTVDLTVQSPHVPVVFYPLAQSYSSTMTLIARTAGEPLAVAETARRELLEVNRNVPVFRTTSLSAHMAEASADSRLTAALVGACGVMALLLATIGVYGVIAYSVTRRQREIGVRLALGARPWHIVNLVLSEGLVTSVSGIVVGLAGAVLSTRALKSLLYGVTPSDPLTYVIVPALLAIVSLIAACEPARRALRVEPNTILRHD